MDDVAVDAPEVEEAGDEEGGFRAGYCGEPQCAGASSEWACQTCGYLNSPHIGAGIIGGHDVSSFTYATTPGSGFHLAGIEDTNGTRYAVEVAASGEIRAIVGSTRYQGQQLVGWDLIFARDGTEEWPVEIFAFSDEPSWYDCAVEIPTYGLAARHDQNLQQVSPYNICPGIPMTGTSLVLAKGEVYSSNHDVQLDPTRVTIGCRSHAAMKMKFIGYSMGSPGAPGSATQQAIDLRQAALRMLTADYCGDGQSWTEVGTPLAWQDPPPSKGGMEYFGCDAYPVEAVWTPSGAECLDEPRLSSRYQHGDVLCGGQQIPYCNGTAEPLQFSSFVPQP